MNPYEETVDTLRDFLRREGYVRCDIAACNCGSWHGRDGLHARWREIKETLAEAGHPLTNANGNTPLRALKELVADRDRLRAALERIAEARPDRHDPAPLTHWAADMQRIARAALAGAGETCDVCKGRGEVVVEESDYPCPKCSAASPASAPHRIPESNDRADVRYDAEYLATAYRLAAQLTAHLATAPAPPPPAPATEGKP